MPQRQESVPPAPSGRGGICHRAFGMGELSADRGGGRNHRVEGRVRADVATNTQGVLEIETAPWPRTVSGVSRGGRVWGKGASYPGACQT